MSEYTIEGDDSMRWDVISDDKPRTPDELEEFIEAHSGDEGPPVEQAPQDETVTCDGCPGDGVYYGAGGTVNGVFQGFTGTCFRCQGKGRMTPADTKRCQYYDNRIRRIHL